PAPTPRPAHRGVHGAVRRMNSGSARIRCAASATHWPGRRKHSEPMRLPIATVALIVLATFAAPAGAGPGDVNPDSVYLVGEVVDPVCTFQHGLLMVGKAQRDCALVRGRVDQGIGFLDLRRRKFYSVIGQNHWDDPKRGFLESLGDTFAVRA